MPPAEMGKATAAAAHRPLLKIKLGGGAIPSGSRRCAPRLAATTLIVDANEGWAEDNLAANLAACAKAGVGADRAAAAGRRATQALAKIERPIPVCADESATALPRYQHWSDAMTLSTSSSTRPAA